MCSDFQSSNLEGRLLFGTFRGGRAAKVRNERGINVPALSGLRKGI